MARHGDLAPTPSASSLLLAADESLQDEYSGIDHNDSYFLVPTFKLESGRVLTNVRVAYRTWGTLSAAADNCLFVPHALTGNAAVNTWWAALLGEGRALDTSRYFVVCANMLGSCYGTTSPLDTVPKAASWVRSRDGTPRTAAGDRYAGDFPHTTIRDTVRLHQLLLVHELHVRAVHAVVGGSAGGMQALEWAIMYPALVRRAVVMACCAAQSAWQLAISEVQRQSIYRDPDWNLGFYALDTPPAHGLSVARQNAMVWYRSPAAYDEKFGRRLQPPAEGPLSAEALAASGGGGVGAPSSYAVEGYLDHQGEKFIERFDANCYVSLTRTLDSHDVGRGRGGVAAALAAVRQPVLVVGITSDVLYPLEMQRELVALLPRATLGVIESPEGHDGFLLESAAIGALVAAALDEPADAAIMPGTATAATVVRPTGNGVTASAVVLSPPGARLPPHELLLSPMEELLMPTAAVLSLITAEAVAKRRAANIEGARTMGCLGAVAW